MRFPHPDDTIVAIATAWEPAPVGIVRLSGPASFRCAAAVAPDQPPADRNANARGWIRPEPNVRLPADLFWFHAPRSYTGQDAVEIHTPGAPALLRVVADRIVQAGARPAQPGEFTARAYLNGKIDAERAESVLGLIHAADADAARRALRQPSRAAEHAVWSRELADLIAALEAGIDFAEEEDVRFIGPGEVLRRIDALCAEMERAAGARRRHERDLSMPHVTLCGLPNAGKSALFNALLGRARAIVSPVPGSTRDVLSAMVELDGLRAMLQDSAGREDAGDALADAARAAAEVAARGADLVVWVHAADTAWSAAEREALDALAPDRRCVVFSKSDLAAPPRDAPACSALRGDGLMALAAHLRARLDLLQGAGDPRTAFSGEAALNDLEAARQAASHDSCLRAPEILILLLRRAWEQLQDSAVQRLSDAVLARIFSTFCIGK